MPPCWCLGSAGPSASTAGESSPPYPWGQSDSSVARTRRHPQALRFSVVTGLVTNTVMHPCGNLGVGVLRPSNSWIPAWIPASRARAECSLSKQPHARARIVPRTRGAFHRCVFFALSSRSTSPMRQPVASQQPHSVTSRRCLQVRQVMASSVRAAHRGRCR